MAASTLSSGINRPWDDTLSYNGINGAPKIVRTLLLFFYLKNAKTLLSWLQKQFAYQKPCFYNWWLSATGTFQDESVTKGDKGEIKQRAKKVKKNDSSAIKKLMDNVNSSIAGNN